MYQVELCAIVKSIINSQHGWAVADQFEDTFEGEEPFEEQNGNALLYIRNSIRGLVESNTFSPQGQEELQEYLDDLEDYLAKLSDKNLYAYNVYQIEGLGRGLFLKIEGNENTIMGLPVEKIKEYLKNL